MATIFVTVGISGCGKSTFANMIENATVISSDEIRAELFGDENCQSDPGLVFKTAHERIYDCLNAGIDVIFDATNVTRWSREETMNYVPDGTKTVGVFFAVEPEEAIRRQQNRARKVPTEIIRKQWASLVKDAQSIPTEFDELIVMN